MYAILYVSAVHMSTVFRQVSNPAANQTPGMRRLPVTSALGLRSPATSKLTL